MPRSRLARLARLARVARLAMARPEAWWAMVRAMVLPAERSMGPLLDVGTLLRN